VAACAREQRVAKNTGLRLRRPLGAYHDGGALLRLRHLALQRLQLRHQVGDAGGLARSLGKLLLHLSAALDARQAPRTRLAGRETATARAGQRCRRAPARASAARALSRPQAGARY